MWVRFTFTWIVVKSNIYTFDSFSFSSSFLFFSFLAFNSLFTFFVHVWECGNKWGALIWEWAKTVHFRTCFNKGVSHHHLGLSVTGGQMGKWKLCSEIKGSLQVCSGWELLAWWTWKWTSYKWAIHMIGFGEHIWLCLVGPELKLGKN